MNIAELANFPITVYGAMEQFNQTISKGRCRVFYRGLNRNNTYITDEFASKLIASAPYTPVKGIYDVDCEDYTDHGIKRSEGRIYGIIPANPNFAWEKHLDSDGIEREYACFDVLYYTALYKEAESIHLKTESMELYAPAIKGEWQFMGGKKVYVFTDGCFLGLQILGDDTTPCFEGAGFYQYSTENEEASILALLEKYEQRLNFSLESLPNGGNNTMENEVFKLSDEQKREILFKTLNPGYGPENDWKMSYHILAVYEKYALIANAQETNQYERVYYTVDQENDTVEITNREQCYLVDVNDEEKAHLDSLNTVEATLSELQATYEAQTAELVSANTTIELLNEEKGTFTLTIEDLNEQISNFASKNNELEEEKSTLVLENSELLSKLNDTTDAYNDYVSRYEVLVAERDELAVYKKNVEDSQKKAIIESYADTVPEEVLATYMSKLDECTLEMLDMQLTYEQKKANPGLFSKNPDGAAPIYIPKDNKATNGINDILSRYEKN